MEEPTDGQEQVAPPASTPTPDHPAPAAAGPNQTLRAIGVTAIIVAVILLGASQVFIITSQNSTNSQIESLDQQIDDLNSSVGDVSDQVDDIAVSAAAAAANNAAGAATPAPAVPAGFLPRFSNQGPDQAVGLTLTTVEGPDAYTDAMLTFDPADGKKRVWMVWAHWCPYCQQELPELNAWWPEASSNYPSTELVTVTTSMDPSRGNALEPYLESSQFVFPCCSGRGHNDRCAIRRQCLPLLDGDGRRWDRAVPIGGCSGNGRHRAALRPTRGIQRLTVPELLVVYRLCDCALSISRFC